MAISATCYYKWTERGVHTNRADTIREVFLSAHFGDTTINAVPGRIIACLPVKKTGATATASHMAYTVICGYLSETSPILREHIRERNIWPESTMVGDPL
jgi:hypothetical protein